jgi:hypothetical protein
MASRAPALEALYSAIFSGDFVVVCNVLEPRVGRALVIGAKAAGLPWFLHDGGFTPGFFLSQRRRCLSVDFSAMVSG